jgi:hypothetical protein
MANKNIKKKKMIVISFLIIILTIVLCFYSKKFLLFFFGILTCSLILFLLQIYFFWESNFFEENEITITKIKYHLNELFTSETNENKIIYQMTHNDIKNFFKNESNFLRDRMEYKISMGEDAVSLADVTTTEKTFSLILLALRSENGFFKERLNWRKPNGLIYLINVCILDPTDRKTIRIMNSIIEDEELKKTLYSPPNNIHDIILAQYVTIVPSQHNNKAFKTRLQYFHPLYNYEAIAIKEKINKYVKNKNCFYS